MNMMSVLPPNAVIEKEGRAVTTSLAVAEAFGKRHERVLDVVRKIDCPTEFRQHNFVSGYYADKNGQMRPMFELTRDGIVLLVMGFTGPKAARVKVAYIERFNQMEAALMSKAFSQPTAPALKPPSRMVELPPGHRVISNDELIELQELALGALKGRTRKDFTEEEKTYMRQAKAQGMTNRDIAEALNRAEGSVSGFFYNDNK